MQICLAIKIGPQCKSFERSVELIQQILTLLFLSMHKMATQLCNSTHKHAHTQSWALQARRLYVLAGWLLRHK